MRVSRKERIREINAGKIEREGNSGRWGEKESKREREEKGREREEFIQFHGRVRCDLA